MNEREWMNSFIAISQLENHKDVAVVNMYVHIVDGRGRWHTTSRTT